MSHRPPMWRRFFRYGYPITAAYLVAMVTLMVLLLIFDPDLSTCNCP